ncbi:MAG: DNA polymerase III subunit gamma/tau [Candidatus Microbacterium phytovorans]|uniref:DNA polymerase III subunit gamma/tau n=1 Tax=Candidatus Microbacterium phytovorans TaxID=3121374 RepID=A0AAJ6B3U1_9MICO|nr:DNA polymerase III subunit gamma/tau [Microbacterium sp.]WEK14600.1 MAG: DNA polymerase III subunit gamma/tau [Microbacterium sp.]
MSRDDDALSWGGDDDPTLDVGGSRPVEKHPPRLPEGFVAVGRGSEDLDSSDGRATEDEAGEVADEVGPQLGNVALVALGLLGGVYLLFTVGWIIGGLRLQEIAPFLNLIPAAYVPAFWLAVAAPAIWFVASLVLTRGRATWVRFVWLVAGAVLLVPWPFIMIGAVGQ